MRARPSHLVAAPGAPRTIDSAATRRNSSTRGITPRRRLGELGRDALLAGSRGGEDGRSSAVRAGSLERSDVGRDRLTDDGMSELERLARFEDRHRRQQVGGGRRLVDRQPRHGGGLGEAGPVAEDGDSANQVGGRSRCRREP